MRISDNRRWLKEFYQNLKNCGTQASAAEILAQTAVDYGPFNGLAVIMKEDGKEKLITSSGSMKKYRSHNSINRTKYYSVDLPDYDGVVIADLYKKFTSRYYLQTAVYLFSLFLSMNKKIRKAEISGIIDPLTGLFNRNYILEEIDFLLKQMNRYGGEFSLLNISLDIPEWMEIKDAEVDIKVEIQQLAKYLIDSFRETDRIGYLSFGEFICILLKSGIERSNSISSRILENYRRKNLHLSLSIGIATYPAESTFQDELIEKVEKAKKIAKSMGGNTASRCS